MNEKIVPFKSYDGTILEGTLLASEAETAAVLFIHGITSSRDELGFHSEFAKFLGENNVSSFRFDYRFHGVNEASLENLTLCGIVNDIDSAYRRLRSEVNSSTKRFFIIATSFGGGLATYWVDRNNLAEVSKVILNAPVIDYEDDVLRRNGLIQEGVLAPRSATNLGKRGYVVSSGIRFGRALINELKYVNGIRSVRSLAERIEIFHGDKDEDVPLASSKRFKGKATKLNIIKGVGHGFGVDGDEELDFPETKLIHQTIYKKTLRIINSSL